MAQGEAVIRYEELQSRVWFGISFFEMDKNTKNHRSQLIVYLQLPAQDWVCSVKKTGMDQDTIYTW